MVEAVLTRVNVCTSFSETFHCTACWVLSNVFDVLAKLVGVQELTEAMQADTKRQSIFAEALHVLPLQFRFSFPTIHIALYRGRQSFGLPARLPIKLYVRRC